MNENEEGNPSAGGTARGEGTSISAGDGCQHSILQGPSKANGFDPPPAIDPAAAMLALFPCFQRGHSTWDPKTLKPNEKGKLVPDYVTVREPVTVEHWARHLAGTSALVIALACDDGTAKVVCVEVDDGSADVMALVNRIKLLRLPLYIHRSKSGGAHILAFLDAFVPNERAREIGRGKRESSSWTTATPRGWSRYFPSRGTPTPRSCRSS
jgi:hypothetical protein